MWLSASPWVPSTGALKFTAYAVEVLQKGPIAINNSGMGCIAKEKTCTIMRQELSKIEQLFFESLLPGKRLTSVEYDHGASPS